MARSTKKGTRRDRPTWENVRQADLRAEAANRDFNDQYKRTMDLARQIADLTTERDALRAGTANLSGQLMVLRQRNEYLQEYRAASTRLNLPGGVMVSIIAGREVDAWPVASELVGRDPAAPVKDEG